MATRLSRLFAGSLHGYLRSAPTAVTASALMLAGAVV